MKTTNLIHLSLGTMALTSCTTTPEKTVNTERPNIILVMADDQGWGDIAYNGNPIVKTPHLDQMAREGVRLDRFYAQAPVCSPTRASCLTGRHPYRTAIDWAGSGFLRDGEVTLAEALKTAGYSTGHFGKWHVGQLSKTIKQGYFPGDKADPKQYSAPWTNGYDEAFVTESMVPTYNPYFHDCGEFSVREGENPYRFIMNKDVRPGDTTGVRWRDNYWTGPGQIVDENLSGDDSKIIMDRALPFIEKNAKSGSPFMTTIWFHTPHTPIVAGTDMRMIYKDLTKEELIKLTGFKGEMTDEKFAEMKMEAQHWFGCLTAMDLQVGRLRKKLKELGISDNTIVWYCSDNGPSYIHDYNSAGHLSGKKATLREGGVRVPGIVEWPAKLKGGKIISTPMSTSDFYPTLLKITGVTMPNQPVVDGIDVLPILDGTTKRRPTPINFQAPVKSSKDVYAVKGSKQMTAVDNRFKLSSGDNGKSWQLFDIVEDPAETKDVIALYPKVARRLKEQLTVWIDSCQDSWDGKDYLKENQNKTKKGE